MMALWIALLAFALFVDGALIVKVLLDRDFPTSDSPKGDTR